MHQITLRMARSLSGLELQDAARKAGVENGELIAAEKDCRSLSYDSAIKLQKLYRLPNLSMIFMGKEEDFRLTNHQSGFDLLDSYIEFIRCNRKNASYIMVWFEVVASGLDKKEQHLVEQALKELSNHERIKIKELHRTMDYMAYCR